MELHEEMAQLSEIRLRLAQTGPFRGYRSADVAGTGSVAFAAGSLQLMFLPEPTASPATYLALWIGAAVVAATGTGLEMVFRFRRASDPMAASLTRLAVEQFVPCVMA